MFHDTHIDFLRYRRFCVFASIVLIVVGLGEVFWGGPLNYGVDLAGGHQLSVIFREPITGTAVREKLSASGLDSQVQPVGDDERSFLLRLPLASEPSEDAAKAALAALSELVANEPNVLDLNRAGIAAIALSLAEHDPAVRAGTTTSSDAELEYRNLLTPLSDVRTDRGVISSWQELEQAGLSTPVLERLEGTSQLGGFSIIGQETVGPQIGSELRTRALLAIVLSIFGMLAYIWIRFDFPFAAGAIVATIHDVAVVIGLYLLARYEINLTTVAALLTLVGYSVNDTVVIFDRMRENRRAQPRKPMLEIMNLSLNQTLTRTIMTSGTTLLAAGSLLVFGGHVLRGFSFVLVVGVIVGTYSSVYIASPVALLLLERRERRAKRRHMPASRTATRAA